jgi:hypothetical protein
MTPPPKPPAEARHREFGKVPAYLVKRNTEMALKRLQQQKEQEAQEAQSSAPPGMRQLSEPERLETLRVLNETRAEVLRALSALPLAVVTFGQNKRMVAIERKCKELEASIKLFSRPVVFVRVDGGVEHDAYQYHPHQDEDWRGASSSSPASPSPPTPSAAPATPERAAAGATRRR